MTPTINKRQAQIVDSILQYLITNDVQHGYNLAQHRQIMARINLQADGEETLVAFKAANFYLPGIPYHPYTFEPNGEFFVQKNEYTKYFIHTGGFSAISQNEQAEKDKQEQLRTSTIDTNKNIKLSAWLSFGVSILALSVSIANCNQKEEKYHVELQQMTNQLKELSKALQAVQAKQIHNYGDTLKSRNIDSVTQK